MKYAVLALILVSVFLLPYPASSQEYGFRLEPLTTTADFTSMDVSGDTVVAVGKAGVLTVWRPDRVEHLSIATVDLSGVSCSRNLCIAVGKGGIVVEIDISLTTTYRGYTPLKKDLISVAYGEGFAVITAADEIYLYRPGGEVFKTLQVKQKNPRAFYSGGKYTVAAEKTVYRLTPSLELEKAADYPSSIIAAFTHRGETWVLASDGLYLGGSRILSGTYVNAYPHPRGILLLRATTVQLYDALDRELRYVATFTREVNVLRLYGGDRVVAAGVKGSLVMAANNTQYLLTAPSGDYATASSDGRGGVLVAQKSGLILRYSNGYFTDTYVVGDEPRAMTSSMGWVAVLGSRAIWRLDPLSGELVKVDAAVKASDYADIAPSMNGLWVALAGASRIVDVGIDGTISTTQVNGKLLAIAPGYAVGEKIAVMTVGGLKTSKQNDTLRDVDVTACGAVAVTDKGRIAYLKPDRIDSTPMAGLSFTAVSVNPRGAYALIGGSKGELVLYDGYKATRIPTALPEAVKSIAWADEKTAIVVTSKGVYRLVETSFPQPQLEVVMPKTLEVFAGTPRRVQFEVKPLNGMSGEVELQLISSNPQIILQQTSLKLSLSPMCTSKAEIGINIPPETPEGSGSVTINYQGRNLASLSISIKRPGGQQQTQPLTFLSINTILPIVLIIVIAVVGIVIFRRLGAGTRARKSI
jgi:hypothetical protein